MTRTPWTNFETGLLTVLYGNIPNRELSELIGRPKQGLQHKAMRLGLTTKLVATYKFCVDCGTKLSRAAIYKSSAKRCFACSMKHHSGELHHNWNGGVSPLRSLTHAYLYNSWIKPILIRDNYTCQECGKRGGDMEVHHDEDRFRDIRDAVLSKYPKLSLDSFENKVFISKLISKAHEDVSGVTLCVRCHSKAHNRKSGELLGTPNANGEGNQQPRPSNLMNYVDGKVQRLTDEDSKPISPTRAPDTTTSLCCEDIV